MNKTQKNNQGFALLLSIIVSSIALAIGLSMLQITLKQLSLGTTTKGSEIAFQAATTGMDCLRFTRNNASNNFLTGPITLDCLVASPVVVSEKGSTPTNVLRYNPPPINWSVGGNKCIEIDIYVYDARAGEVKETIPNSGEKTCAAGDVCTYGFSRGYNRGCNELSGSIFAVQRELTVEF